MRLRLHLDATANIPLKMLYYVFNIETIYCIYTIMEWLFLAY